MKKVYGNHGQLHITAGDTVKARHGGVGTVVKVHKKFDASGNYGNIADYQVDTGDGFRWIPDYMVTHVEYA